MLVLEDAGGEGLLRVVLMDRDRFLQDDGPPVHGRIDEMDRAAGDLDAGGDRIALGVRPGERRQARRMDVDDPVRELADERTRDQAHEAREEDHPRPSLPKDFYDFPFDAFALLAAR